MENNDIYEPVINKQKAYCSQKYGYYAFLSNRFPPLDNPDMCITKYHHYISGDILLKIK